MVFRFIENPILRLLTAAFFCFLTPETAVAEPAPSAHGWVASQDREPPSPRYHRLREALDDYRAIEARGGWPAVPEEQTLRIGMQDDAVSRLRERLAITGDLENGKNGTPYFDQILEAAVHRFQTRHGLAVDGIVGANTFAALNVPAKQRVEQLEINLERRRAMPDDLGQHYVFVNMADFVLKVVKNSKTVLTMKIVVGTPYRQTPLFSASMTYIDFNPFWNIPDRIAREEILPLVRRNPSHLNQKNIKILSSWNADAVELTPDSVDWSLTGARPLPYRLRQEPGPLNSLGRIKFMFPNSHAVYLHDTPAKQLFTSQVRAFSHGCIRVENPELLADHLLPDLSREEISQLVTKGIRKVIHLAKPVPVHLSYLTAWVNKDRSVHFRADIYRRDQRQTASLQ